jgi:thiol-disulfide isomerase/thioredoxin
MKKIYLIGLVVSTLICTATVIYSFVPKKERLPAFDIELTDFPTTLFNTRNLPNGHATVLIYFSPDCEDCQEETRNILSRMADLKQITFCYVSNDTLEKIKIFHDYFRLGNFKNIIIGRDSKYVFISHYRPKGTPTIVLFNKQKEVYAYMTGKMSVDNLLHYIKSMK